jgi:hypothetical protein
MRSLMRVLVAALVLAPLGVQAADLVVWWEEGFNPEEDAAVREMVAAFERKTGKHVELVQPSVEDIETKAQAAVSAGQPPDFLFGTNTDYYYGQWAEEGRLIDLSDVIAPFASLFDPDAIRYATLLDATTGRRALHALPMGFATNNVHSGAISSSRLALPWPTFPNSGSHSGYSGVTRSSRRCAEPPVARTSGVWVCPCPSRKTQLPSSSSSWKRTKPTT